MIPLTDDNPVRSPPLVNILLIAGNLAIFLVLSFPSSQLGVPPMDRIGFVPLHLFRLTQLPPGESVSTILSIFTAMFTHAGWLHLLGNMLYLFIFGDNVEDALGHLRYLLFYLLCGIAAALVHTAATPRSAVPVVGASGAIAGVLGAYLYLFPGARIRTLLFLGIFIRVTALPAIVLIGFWATLQVLSLMAENPDNASRIAWYAHIGGFLAGLGLAIVMRKKKWWSARRRSGRRRR